MTFHELQKLLNAPHSVINGEAALNWARDAQSRVLRGDRMIGIMDQEEYSAIPQALTYAGRSGHTSAWRELASFHLQEGDPWEAARSLEEALSTTPAAIVPLAEIQWLHLRYDIDPAAAGVTYRRLLDHQRMNPDDAEALYILGLMTWGGFGTPEDHAASALFHERAATLGSGDAQFELYVLYSTSQGVVADPIRARSFLEQAAHGGHPRAAFNMGALSATGQGGFELDIAQTVHWYTVAAYQNHARAARTLAVMFLTGSGVEVDTDQGLEFLNLAEELGEDVDDLREQFGY